MSIRKNILVTMLIFTLLAASFTAGTLISKPSYATITSEGNWSIPGDYVKGELEEHTFTVTQTGKYYFELTGESGGIGYAKLGSLQSVDLYGWGGIGGNVEGTAMLTAGDVVTIGIEPGPAAIYIAHPRGGSKPYINHHYGGKGGDAIYVEVNGEMLIGAGGGGGKASHAPSSVPPANLVNSGIFGPGGQGTAGYGNTADPNTISGQSGANYFDATRLISWSAPNINKTTGFKITLMSTTNGTYNRSDVITSSYTISTMDNNGDRGFVFAGTISKDARVTETGTYIIECSGEGHQFMAGYSSAEVNYGGRIIAEIYLEAGDYIQANVVPGGATYWGDERGKGGKATLVSVNGTPILGAGGSGGHGYYHNKSSGKTFFYTGGSVNTTNNATFGSGSGGIYDMYVPNSAACVTHYGQPGSGGSGVGQAGDAGSNYLNDSLATLISTPNDGRDAYYIVKMEGARDYIPKIPFGKYKQMPALAIVDDTTLSDGTCETFTAQLPYALYEITLNGGLYGGSLVGSMMLKQGDKLYFTQIPTYISGGNGGYLGGNAVSVYYDDAFSTDPEVLIAGVGGGAMNANDTGIGQAGGNKTIYYNYGEFTEMTGTVGSSIFGSGGSSTTQAPGNPGADGLINDLYGNGASPGEGAANFVDTGYLTSYTSSPNSGVTIPTGNFSIRLVSLGTPDQIAAIETLKNIADLQKRLTVLEAPIITCQDGVPFETRVHTYSHITHTAIAVDGIQVLNEDLEDGYIVVKGSVNGVGYHDIFIHGLKFTFNVLESPNSSNVNVLLE